MGSGPGSVRNPFLSLVTMLVVLILASVAVVLSAVLFYVSVPSQRLRQRPLPGRSGWLCGLGCLIAGTVLFSRVLQPVAAILIVMTLLMVSCIGVTLLVAVGKQEGRSL